MLNSASSNGKKPTIKVWWSSQAGAGGGRGDGGFWRTRAGCGVEPERAKLCGGLHFCQQKWWLSGSVICLVLPYSPRTSLGINERGPDRRAGAWWASDADDLSSSRLAWARRHMKTEGRGKVAGLTKGLASTWACTCGTLPTQSDSTLSVWRG